MRGNVKTRASNPLYIHDTLLPSYGQGQNPGVLAPSPLLCWT